MKLVASSIAQPNKRHQPEQELQKLPKASITQRVLTKVKKLPHAMGFGLSHDEPDFVLQRSLTPALDPVASPLILFAPVRKQTTRTSPTRNHNAPLFVKHVHTCSSGELKPFFVRLKTDPALVSKRAMSCGF